jgi:hypothetical protein
LNGYDHHATQTSMSIAKSVLGALVGMSKASGSYWLWRVPDVPEAAGGGSRSAESSQTGAVALSDHLVRLPHFAAQRRRIIGTVE